MKYYLVPFTLIAALASCVPYQPPTAYQRGQMQKIIVTPGDISQPYDILGPVEWPGAGYISFGGPCDPDRLREEAVTKNGAVDAIIGFIQWQDGRQSRCSGTAIRFRQAWTAGSNAATQQVAPVGQSDADTAAGDDTAQVERRLKWLRHLKETGAMSEKEYQQYRSEIAEEHPGMKIDP